MERVPQLVEDAQHCLSKCPVTKVALKDGNVNVFDAYSENPNDMWNEQLFKALGPFDFIHVGFSIQPEDDNYLHSLRSFLNPTDHARILIGLKDEFLFVDCEGNQEHVAMIPGLARMEKGSYAKPTTREEKIESLQSQLQDWRRNYERETGRKPTRADLFSDPEAKALFQEFSQLTKIS